MPKSRRRGAPRTWIGIALLAAAAGETGFVTGCGSSRSSTHSNSSTSDAGALAYDATAIAPAPGEDGGDAGCVHGPFPSPDIYDEHCNFDLAAYQHLARAFSAEDGLNYRFGPDSTYYHATPEDFPLLPRAQVRLCGSGPINGPPLQDILYQIGDDCSTTNAGFYSTVEGLVLYNIDPQFPDAGEGNGVDNIGICNYFYNVFYYFPSPSADLGDPTVGYLDHEWLDAGGGPVRNPTAVARGIAPTYGQTSQCGFIAFADGVIGTVGTNTENCGYVTNVPSGLVPTAVGLTNGSEFLLVTMWDPVNVKSSLGVFSIDADFAGHKDFDGKIYAFQQHLPGFPSIGYPTSMKYLGAIDLPGMIAPTDVSVASNYRQSFFYGNGGYENPAKFDLTQEAQWATFTGTGSNAGNRSTAGFAMVASRSERKVIFVDLQPLFDAFNKEYFTDFTTFMTTQTNWGPAPNQWPFTFDVQPQATPVVVTTVTTAEIPTAIYAGRYGESDPTKAINALVATMDGTLHIYQVGGLIDATPAKASDIREIGSMQVGKNPVYLGKKDSALEIIVAARGDRSVNFATLTGATGTITSQIQDQGLLDPVYVDEADNEGFGQHVLSVADLHGKQIVNYRNATVTLPEDGGVYPLPQGPDGGPVIECGGAYSVRGEPFAVSGTNVP